MKPSRRAPAPVLLGTVSFPSGRASVSDSSYFYDDALIMEVGRGPHEVHVIIEGPRGDPAISSIEIRERPGRVAEELGTFGVDFGEIAICDRALAEAMFTQLGEANMSEYFDALDAEHAVQPIEVRGCPVLLVRPRGGDGAYSVLRLRDEQGVCGFSISLREPVD